MSLRRIRLFTANKYLDWAEKLPRFQGGLLCSLQRIREHQRKWSEECYADTRAPEGASIKYKELVLIDVFELESFDRLGGGLKKIFPNLKRSKDLLENIEWSAGSLHSSGWHRVGMVSRSRTLIPIRESAIDPMLPSYIDYVSVEVYGITPSVTAIALTFGMTDEVTTNLNRLNDHYYLPDVEFKKMIPWGQMAGGYSENAVEAVMQRTILKYMAGIREECEKWTSKYFKGCLLNDGKSRSTSLGAIEIFQVIGIPSDEDEKLKWKTKTKAGGWLHSLGISIDDSANFSRGQFTFCWNSSGREQQMIPTRILVSNDDANHELEFVVHSLVAPIAIISYLRFLRKTVERSRVDVYRATKEFTQRVSKRNITNSLILKRSIMILNRMRLELEHNESWFFHLMESISDFRSTLAFYGNSGLDKVLRDHVIKEISHIEEHGQIAEKTITDYINIQNILVMFILQKRMLVLTIVAALATIISTLVSYEKITELWGIVVGKL